MSDIDWSKATPLERIIAISNFEDNWDGYSAPIFSTYIIQHSLVLLCCIYMEFYNKQINDISIFITPCADPSIVFHLKSTNSEIDIWVEYNDNKTDLVYCYFNCETHDSYEFELDKLSEIMEELC